jgi:circadian clock protein KaiC
LGVHTFRFGVEGLDYLFKGVLRRGSLVLIYGRPGVGKTLLATTLCYRNALDGRKCYYVSFYEDRDRLYEVMKGLNMDLNTLTTDVFRYVKLPLVTKEGLKDFIDGLLKDINTFRPDIVVIDSITPLLNVLGGSSDLRVLLHNFLYELPKIINGLVVLIAESVDVNTLTALAYVADVVIGLKSRVVNDIVVRELVVDKVRGSQTPLAKIPFSIVSGSGITAWVPPRLEEVPTPNYSKSFYNVCSLFKDLIGDHLYGGWYIYVTYDTDARSYDIITYIITLALLNNSKTLLISYKFSPDDILKVVESYLSRKGVKVDVKELFKDNLILKGFNLAVYSVEEVYNTELELISKVRPDTVMFFGIDLLHHYYRRGTTFKYLHNQVLYLRKLNILTFRVGSYVNEEHYRANTSLADAVIRLLKTEDLAKQIVYVWVRGRNPKIVTYEELSKCLSETIQALSSNYLQHSKESSC